MRQLVNFFKIDGQPMFAPDGDMQVELNDLDASDSGRDQSGVMHRVVIRYDVETWSFNFQHCTDTEVAYTLALMHGKANFAFTHPVVGSSDQTAVCTAYCAKKGIAWHSKVTKDWRNFKFNIIQC